MNWCSCWLLLLFDKLIWAYLHSKIPHYITFFSMTFVVSIFIQSFIVTSQIVHPVVLSYILICAFKFYIICMISRLNYCTSQNLYYDTIYDKWCAINRDMTTLLVSNLFSLLQKMSLDYLCIFSLLDSRFFTRLCILLCNLCYIQFV